MIGALLAALLAQQHSMDSDSWLENIGEIMLSDDDEEFCWMLPEIFISSYECSVASPYFSFDQESWRLIIMPSNGNEPVRGENDFFGLFLWLKGSSTLKKKYKVHLGIKNWNGSRTASYSGELDAFHGFGKWDFISCNNIPIRCILSGRLKIFCIIQRKEDDEIPLRIALKNTKDESEAVTSVNKKQKVAPEAKGVDRMAQNFSHLLDSGSATDVILKTNDHEFHAHRLILSTRCPVFSAMFQHDMSEKKTGEVDISDCSTSGFKVFLQYLYSGKADSMSPANVIDLYYIADKYQVDDLKVDCVEYMKNNLSMCNICDVISLSIRHNQLDLENFATKYFCRNIRRILRSGEWKRYICENPLQANELLIKALNA